jgi:hypothetical protein
MEVSQHARYTCTFCGKVHLLSVRLNTAADLNTSGHCKTNSCWYLELQSMQKSHCWGCLDSINYSCCHRSQVRLSISCFQVFSKVTHDLALSVVSVRLLRHRCIITFRHLTMSFYHASSMFCMSPSNPTSKLDTLFLLLKTDNGPFCLYDIVSLPF